LELLLQKLICGIGGEGGKLIVFRLSDLEEFLADLIEWHHHVDTLLHRYAN
jgi:hypothetical protein